MSRASGLFAQASLLVRQLARNKRRTLLTFLGLVISFYLYTSLESVLYTLTRVVGQTARETILFVRPRDRVAFWRAELPHSYTPQVRATPGVEAAAPLRFYFGAGRAEGSFAVVMGVDLDPYLEVRAPEGLEPGELGRFRAERSAALVGRKLLDRNGWSVGDHVTIRGRGRAPSLRVHVQGDIDGEDRLGGIALVHLAYLDEVLGGAGRVTFIQARASSPEVAPALARALDERFARYSVPTETITEKAHLATVLGSLSDALGALRVIGLLTLAVTVLVVGNSVAMSVRERTVEIGTLRALGFGRRRVMVLVLGEAILVAIPGGVVGALAAWATFETGVVRIPTEAGFTLVSDASVVARAALLAIPVGALAGLQPAWSAVRMKITDALRYAD